MIFRVIARKKKGGTDEFRTKLEIFRFVGDQILNLRLDGRQNSLLVLSCSEPTVWRCIQNISVSLLFLLRKQILFQIRFKRRAKLSFILITMN